MTEVQYPKTMLEAIEKAAQRPYFDPTAFINRLRLEGYHIASTPELSFDEFVDDRPCVRYNLRLTMEVDDYLVASSNVFHDFNFHSLEWMAYDTVRAVGVELMRKWMDPDET